MEGVCYVVATPIGNLDDITLRAVKILSEVDLIAAEDTRVSANLLNHLGIKTLLTSLHARNEKRKSSRLVDELKNGKSIALISDAGTPGISDPGARFVEACVREGVRVEPIPGASAFLAALSASGMPVNRFWFEGFLPNKKGRQKRLARISALDAAVILYESPYRIQKLLEQLKEYLPAERQVVIAREITKKFEEFVRGSVEELIGYFENHPVKGEFVVLIAPPEFKGWKKDEI